MQSNKPSVSRRELVTHLGVGVAVTAGIPMANAQKANDSTTATFVDPVENIQANLSRTVAAMA
jgi:hypothetical protein